MKGKPMESAKDTDSSHPMSEDDEVIPVPRWSDQETSATDSAESEGESLRKYSANELTYQPYISPLILPLTCSCIPTYIYIYIYIYIYSWPELKSES